MFRKIVSAFLLLCFLVSFASCEVQRNIKVTWLDADGAVLSEAMVASEEEARSRMLPQDTDAWHYTSWAVSYSGDHVIFTAVRVPRFQIVWQDAEGVELHRAIYNEGEEKPVFDLPNDDEKWDYLDWTSEEEGEGVTRYTLQKMPNPAYFEANVFQIVTYDINGDPIATGSGFVFDKDGWFITNEHVLNGSHSAVAYFDVKDRENGSQYTKLKIEGGTYYDESKDIFIGKLTGFEVLENFWKDIAFTQDYAEGDTCYTVGYPNSSVKMEINSGVILEEYSNIHSKINDLYYVLSDSYIAPGSSGGILMDVEFRIIGITSIGLYEDNAKEVYLSGGSIPAFVFEAQLDKAKDKLPVSLDVIYETGVA